MIVYVITNKINGKMYIGQTVASLKKRWSDHCQKSSMCRVLLAAIKKYGRENFDVKVLTYCNSLEEMNHREQYYITLFNTLAPNGYNLMAGGKNSIRSEETKQKMSASQLGIRKPKTVEHREKISESLKGRKQSKEWINKRIAPLVGRKRPLSIMENLRLTRIGTKHTAETKSRMSKAHTGKRGYWNGKVKSADHIEKIRESKKRPVYVPEIDVLFDSIKDASQKLNIYSARIHEVLRGEVTDHKGYTFIRM
jgi:group I intron endonuclease